MADIFKTNFPENSILNVNNKEYDYSDSYSGIINDPENKLNSINLGRSFFNSSPFWVEHLFNLRNKIVSLIGLKTSAKHTKQELLKDFKGNPGDQVGLFKVFNRTENEIILGENDKHLNFKVSLFINPIKDEDTKKEIIISTVVEYNNLLGKAYFFPVKYFHKIIVPVMLQAMIKDLKN